MVFYAYAKNIENDTTYRYLIAAPTLEVLDEWWRVVDQKNIGFARVTPEFYTFSQTVLPPTTVTDPRYAPEFLNKVIFTLLNDRDGRILSVIPPQQVSDHISGNTFYIRSSSDKHLFWYAGENSRVYASRQGRTRFRIQARDKKLLGKVLIGRDDIEITAASDSRAYVSSDGSNGLVLSQHSDVFNFDDFKGNFLGEGWSDLPVIKSSAGEDWEIVQ